MSQTHNNEDTNLPVVADEQTLAVRLDEGSVAALAAQRTQLKQFIEKQLKEQQDFGRFGPAKKNTLLKPGAEKLANIFKLRGQFNCTHRAMSPELVYFEYHCDIIHIPTGHTVASCDASANSGEQDHWQSNPLKFCNTIQKIAQKRAFVGGVILAVNASDFFTQDLDDMPLPASSSAAKSDTSNLLDLEKIPFGRDKGKSVRELSEEELNKLCDWAEGKLDKKSKFYGRNKAQLDAWKNVLAQMRAMDADKTTDVELEDDGLPAF